MTRAPLLALLATACSTPAPSDAAEADTGAGDRGLPAAWTEYYAVESRIEAGGFTFDESYWARRLVDPAASAIDEELVATADGTVTRSALAVDAGAATFTLVINDGEYTGAGTLSGPAWAWTSWASRAEMDDGTYVESEDRVTDTGLLVDKVGYSAAGGQEWTLTDTFTTVDEATWQAGLDALGR